MALPKAYADRKIYALSDVSRSLNSVIRRNYQSDFLLKAEIAKLNYYPHSGHCYPDLVEKNEQRIVAQMRAIIWKDDYRRIALTFRNSTGQELLEGVEILCRATLSYHEQYGLSITILDILPEYTLGAMAKAKQEAITRLKAEGLYDLNRQVSLPLLCKHLAIVSVETSKGFQDFSEMFRSLYYPIQTYLYPALLQGDQAVPSIITAFERIRKALPHIEAVVLIRGGGGDIGLSCYDHYDLAKTVACFPIPVITGIGHASNVSICELVSHQACITPTDTANFFIEQQNTLIHHLAQAQAIIQNTSRERIRKEQHHLLQTKNHLVHLSEKIILQQRRSLDTCRKQLRELSQRQVLRARERMKQLEDHVRLLDPKTALKRGFSLSYHKEQLLKESTHLKIGQRLKTQLHKGLIYSTITDIQHEQEEN